MVAHASQSILKDDFVEFDPNLKSISQLEESRAQTRSVDLSRVPDLPIYMVQGLEDTICVPEDTAWTRAQLTGVSDLTYTEVPGDHFSITTSGDLSYF